MLLWPLSSRNPEMAAPISFYQLLEWRLDYLRKKKNLTHIFQKWLLCAILCHNLSKWSFLVLFWPLKSRNSEMQAPITFCQLFKGRLSYLRKKIKPTASRNDSYAPFYVTFCHSPLWKVFWRVFPQFGPQLWGLESWNFLGVPWEHIIFTIDWFF